MSEFTWPVRVYYEDTDAGGVVYYANYLKFMERARTEWLRSLGFEQDRLMVEDGVIFAVRRVEVDYLKPARFNDLLQASARVQAAGGASITFAQQIRRQARAGGMELLAEGTIIVACLDAHSFRPRRIPTQLSEAIQRVR